jgi:hypothetical protein
MPAQSRSRSRGAAPGNQFSLPSQEAFDELVRDHKRDAKQARELHLLIRHVAEDLRADRERRQGRQPRKELVRRLKRVAKCVDDLGFELRRWRNTIDDFLPQEAQAEIGLLMSFSAMEAALCKELRFRELGSVIESLTAEGSDFRPAQIEERLKTRRESRGLEHGGQFFVHYIERINREIKSWLELDRLNRGGRPPKSVARDYLLIRLVEGARVIIGRRATATAGGRFVRLCAAVCVACGLDDRGIERAVEKAISVVKSRRPTGPKR